MSINVSELIWTILCFFVLLFVLKKQSAAQSMKDTREQLHAEEQAVSAELEQELPALVETLAAALLKETR